MSVKGRIIKVKIKRNPLTNLFVVTTFIIAKTRHFYGVALVAHLLHRTLQATPAFDCYHSIAYFTFRTPIIVFLTHDAPSLFKSTQSHQLPNCGSKWKCKTAFTRPQPQNPTMMYIMAVYFVHTISLYYGVLSTSPNYPLC